MGIHLPVAYPPPPHATPLTPPSPDPSSPQPQPSTSPNASSPLPPPTSSSSSLSPSSSLTLIPKTLIDPELRTFFAPVVWRLEKTQSRGKGKGKGKGKNKRGSRDKKKSTNTKRDSKSKTGTGIRRSSVRQRVGVSGVSVGGGGGSGGGRSRGNQAAQALAAAASAAAAAPVPVPVGVSVVRRREREMGSNGRSVSVSAVASPGVGGIDTGSGSGSGSGSRQASFSVGGTLGASGRAPVSGNVSGSIRGSIRRSSMISGSLSSHSHANANAASCSSAHASSPARPITSLATERNGTTRVSVSPVSVTVSLSSSSLVDQASIHTLSETDTLEDVGVDLMEEEEGEGEGPDLDPDLDILSQATADTMSTAGLGILGEDVDEDEIEIETLTVDDEVESVALSDGATSASVSTFTAATERTQHSWTSSTLAQASSALSVSFLPASDLDRQSQKGRASAMGLGRWSHMRRRRLRLSNAWIQSEFTVMIDNAAGASDLLERTSHRHDEEICGILRSGIFELRLESESLMILNDVGVRMKFGRAGLIDSVDVDIAHDVFREIELRMTTSRIPGDPFLLLREWFGEDSLRNAHFEIFSVLLCSQNATPPHLRPDPTLEPTRLGNLIAMAHLRNVSGTIFASPFYRTRIELSELHLIKSDLTTVRLRGKMSIEWKGEELRLPIVLGHLQRNVKRIKLASPILLPGTEAMRISEVLELFNLKHPTPGICYVAAEDGDEEEEECGEECGGVMLRGIGMVIGTADGFYRRPTVEVDSVRLRSCRNHRYRERLRISEQIVIDNLTTIHENMAVTSTGYHPGVQMFVKGRLMNHPLSLQVQVSTYKVKAGRAVVTMATSKGVVSFNPQQYLLDGEWFHLFAFMHLEDDLRAAIPSFMARRLIDVSIINVGFSYDRLSQKVCDSSLVLKFVPNSNAIHPTIPGLLPTASCADVSFLLDSQRMRVSPGLELRFKLYDRQITLSPTEKGVLEMKYDSRFLFSYGDHQRDYLLKLPLGALLYEHGVASRDEEESLYEKDLFLTEYWVSLRSLRVRISGYLFRYGASAEPESVSLTWRGHPSGNHLRTDPVLTCGRQAIHVFFPDEFKQELFHCVEYSDVVIVCQL